jgi:cell division protein FtsB
MKQPPHGKITIRGALLLAAALALIITAIAPAREMLRQREEIERLEKTLAGVQRSNKELKEETSRLNTDAYIEQQARERLGLIKPGEEPFLVVPPKQEPPPEEKPKINGQAKQQAGTSTAKKSWWSGVVEFFADLFSW